MKRKLLFFIACGLIGLSIFLLIKTQSSGVPNYKCSIIQKEGNIILTSYNLTGAYMTQSSDSSRIGQIINFPEERKERFLNAMPIVETIDNNAGPFLDLIKYYLPESENTDIVEQKLQYENSTSFLTFDVYNDNSTSGVWLFGSSGNSRVYVNGEFIDSLKLKRAVNDSYQNHIYLTLIEGKNTVTIALKNEPFENILSLSLYSAQECEKYITRNFSESFLENSIISENDSIKILDIVKTSIFSEIQIKSVGNQKIASIPKERVESLDLSKILDFNQLYKIELTIGDLKLSQNFFFGDLSHIKTPQQSSLKFKLEKDSSLYYGLQFRLEKLINSNEHEKRVNAWDRRVVKVLYQQAVILENIKIHFESQGGIYINNYKSNIDDSYQYYVLVVPKMNSQLNEAKPLIVIIRPNLSNHRHFLVSPTLAKHLELEELLRLANEYGYTYLLSSNRFYANEELAAINESEIFEAINSLKELINIDENRVFLNGSCSAGSRALKLATNHPDYFAGISLYSPSLIRTNNSINSHQNLYNPLHYLNNLKDVGIYLNHDSTDTHTSIHHSRALLDSVKSNLNIVTDFDNYSKYIYNRRKGSAKEIQFFNNFLKRQNSDTLELITSDLKHSKTSWLQLTNFNSQEIVSCKAFWKEGNDTIHVIMDGKFNVKINNQCTKQISPTKLIISDSCEHYNLVNSANSLVKGKNTQGPILDFFSNRFVVITNKKNMFSANLFLINQWKEYFYSKPILLDETNLTQEVLVNNNIVMISDSYDHILDSSQQKFPLYEMEEIKFNGSIYPMEDVIFVSVFPNPYNQNKYILYTNFDANKHKNILNIDILTSRFLWKDGYYDFELYHINNDRLKVLHRGYYDKFWNLII